MYKKFLAISSILVVLSLFLPASAFANGTTRESVSYYECAAPVALEKEWAPGVNYMMRNASYVSDILSASDDRLSGTLYGNEKVVIAHKDGSAVFQGTAMIVLPDDRGVWEGSWRGDGVFGENWELDIVFHGVAGEVKGLQAFITTTSDPTYWCANSTGEIVNPGGK